MQCNIENVAPISSRGSTQIFNNNKGWFTHELRIRCLVLPLFQSYQKKFGKYSGALLRPIFLNKLSNLKLHDKYENLTILLKGWFQTAIYGGGYF